MAQLALIAQRESGISGEARTLLTWAIGSTYRDCVRLGVGREADAILRAKSASMLAEDER